MVEKQQVLKCCVHFWRIVFVILNSIFLVIGLALIGLSIYLLATQNDLKFLTGSGIASGAVLILISGFITAVISFIGVVGAIGMRPALLIVYIVLLFVIVILEIIAGILGFVYRVALVELSAIRAQDAIEQYRPVDDDEYREDVNAIVDFLQNNFGCCGYSNNTEWFGTEYFNITQMFPGSCNCTETGDSMNCVDVDSQSIHNTACNGIFSDFLNSNLITVGGVGIAFGIFEVIGIGVAIALTCCFCYMRKNDDDYDFTKAI